MNFSPVISIPASTRSLSRIWAGRYLPDLSRILTADSGYSIAHLLECLSDYGRYKTVDSIRKYLKISCELAGLEVHQLFAGCSNLVNLAKVRRLATSVEQVYETILQFYEQRSQVNLGENLNSTGNWVPLIEALSIELQPSLAEMYAQHLADEDPRTLGFVTTQFHFTTRMILQRLNPVEKTLIGSFFQLAEEQICIPWQEITELAIRYDRMSPELRLMERLLPQSDAIALKVCEQARDLYPQFKSRRGGWKSEVVIASMMRDLNMFQGYLWLCMLLQDFSPMTVRLLPLCLMVFPSVNVSWEFIDQTMRLLVQEVRSHLTDEQWLILQPYAVGLIDIFSIENHREL